MDHLFTFDSDIWADKLHRLLDMIVLNQGFIVLEKTFQRFPQLDPPHSMKSFVVRYDFAEDIITFIAEDDWAFTRLKVAIDTYHSEWPEFSPCDENENDILWKCFVDEY